MEKAAVAPQISLTAINFGLTFLTIGFSNSKFETRLLQFTEINMLWYCLIRFDSEVLLIEFESEARKKKKVNRVHRVNRFLFSGEKVTLARVL